MQWYFNENKISIKNGFWCLDTRCLWYIQYLRKQAHDSPSPLVNKHRHLTKPPSAVYVVCVRPLTIIVDHNLGEMSPKNDFGKIQIFIFRLFHFFLHAYARLHKFWKKTNCAMQIFSLQNCFYILKWFLIHKFEQKNLIKHFLTSYSKW